jgi:hypothetical protein
MDQEKDQLEKEILKRQIKLLKTPFYIQQDLWKSLVVAYFVSSIPFINGKVKQLFSPKIRNYIVRKISSVGNSDYSLALYGHNVDPKLLSLAKKSLENEGYSLTNCKLLQGQRPSWLATSPTVLYYDNSTVAAAQQVAQKLQKATGKPFKCQMGAGFGVSANNTQRTLKIHLVL